MKNTKRSTQAAVSELNVLIPEAVALQQQIDALEARLKPKRDAVKAILTEQALPGHVTPDAHQALLIPRETFAWDVMKLSLALTPEDFETLCPHKADGKELRALLDSGVTYEAKLLRKCAKVTFPKALELRAPGAVAEAADEVAEKREAA